jgi:cell division protein FtsB
MGYVGITAWELKALFFDRDRWKEQEDTLQKQYETCFKERAELEKLVYGR